jgi:hypothetical protein
VSPGVPGANAGIPLVIRPVFLEVLQQAASTPDGGAMPTVLAWASAHLFDPTTGAEVTEGSVTLAAGGEAAPVPMPYTSNAGGTKSFYAALPAGTMGGTSFAITTSYTELGASPVTWKLAGEPATFQGAITGPSSSVPANQPLPVTWVAVPMASYSVTELFVAQGSSFVSTYVSPVVNAPNVTTETIPASALGAPGSYLLNESYANATCPATADGCVYNVSTAAMNLTVN